MVSGIIARKYRTKRILIDTGSSADILFLKCFDQMKTPRKVLRPYNKKIIGFTNHAAPAEGLITLDVKLGEEPHTAERKVTFVVMNIDSPCDAILGRPTLNALQAAVSTYHGAIKFPSDDGAVGICKANLVIEDAGDRDGLRQTKDPQVGATGWSNNLEYMEHA